MEIITTMCRHIDGDHVGTPVPGRDALRLHVDRKLCLDTCPGLGHALLRQGAKAVVERRPGVRHLPTTRALSVIPIASFSLAHTHRFSVLSTVYFFIVHTTTPNLSVPLSLCVLCVCAFVCVYWSVCVSFSPLPLLASLSAISFSLSFSRA